MANAVWVAVLVELLVLVNHGYSVAPGDKELICEDLRSAGAVPIPAYSANMRVLMDSWNYQNLLPLRTGAVWQEVDNDVNNPSGITTNWIQASNTPCGQSVQVCGFRAGLQDNWLITQLINRTVNGTRLRQVSVTIEFELRNCDVTLNCQRTFNTHVYETSVENATAARNINNYRQVRRVSPDITTGARVNETIVVDFNTNHSSFYFAIQDEATCIVITRLIVFYHICPPGYAYNRVNGECTSLNQLACESLDRLISNDINAEELECVKKSDCSGLQCFSQNSFLKNFVELFDLTFLPCTKPSPTLWIQLLGRQDPTNNNKRSVIFSRNVTESGSVDLSVGSGGITFGVYRFIANFSEDYSTVAIAVQLMRIGVTSSVVDYTDVWFDTGKCSIESTTTAPPTMPPLITTTGTPPTHRQVLTPPDVEPHCTHVNWRNSPNVSCEVISGYVVRLFNSDTNKSVERRVDATGTFHNFPQSDKELIEKKSTTVQVRVVSSTEEGPYSLPQEVGCYRPLPSTVYFELKGERYENNSEVSILAIGEDADALLCKTDKENCCSNIPDRFGEFYYPHGVRVPIKGAQQDFYRNRGDQLIRLNRRADHVTFPTGRYFCEIPDAAGVNQKIFINIT